jgi:4-oxalocrotonate tautomerase
VHHPLAAEIQVPFQKKTEYNMPYVNIKITREGATTEQKARLIRETTRLLADILGKNPQTTVVVIEEVETDNWGIGGETVTVRRKREQVEVGRGKS